MKHDNWSKPGVNGNFQTGCENNCRYCYAHSMGEKFKWTKDIKSWDRPEIREDAVTNSHKLYDVQVMCFTSHDITENNVQSAISVIQKLLHHRNKVVIVSKPRLAVIERLCAQFQESKDKIVFRFTITTTNQELMSFWERNASSYEERKECLKYAYDRKWQTSVAVEPILDIDDADNLVAELIPFVNHSMWFGLMSQIDNNVRGDSPEIQAEKDKIKNDQVLDRIKALVLKHYLNSMIFWKNNIVDLLGWETPPEPAMDIAHVPKELKWLRWLDESREADPGVGIERITGSNRVLVVAPHAFKRDGERGADDEMTGELAQLLAEKYGFYALINHKYKRVESLKEANKSQGLVNCRSLKQVEKHLQEEFFIPFLAMVEEIKLKYGPPVIIHVHGIDNGNILGEVKDKSTSVLIGIGPQLGSGNKNVYSAPSKPTKDFIRRLGDLGVIAETASKTSDYRGGHKDNINQYFRLPDSFDESVQSFQLEIKKTGCRDNIENIERLANALGTVLTEIAEKNSQKLPALHLELASSEIEQTQDEALVAEATQTLSQIFSKHFENAMMDSGRYLIQTFYNNDYELARNKTPSKGESLRQLIIRLQGDPGAPKKSWIYNSVKLAVDHRDFSSFHTYGKLQLSHKVALLPVKTLEQKRVLIDQTVKEKWSVRDLKAQVASLNERSDKPDTQRTDRRSLAQVVDNPDILFSEGFLPMLELDDLSRKHIHTLNKLSQQVGKKLAEIDTEMKKLQGVSDKYKGLLQNLASAKANKAQKNGTVRGGMNLRLISVSRRTDIPAFYGDWFMKQLNQGFVGFKNPSGPGKSLIPLKPDDVDCFIFWSKNYEPFLKSLEIIKSRGYNCYLHFTITGLPREFESNVVEPLAAVETMKRLRALFSPSQINWRYDPIVISEKTNPDFHRRVFSDLAARLEGYIEHCYISFPTLYGKVKRNIEKFKKEKGIQIVDPDTESKVKLANELAEIAQQHRIQMHSCCGDYLTEGLINRASCVDGARISKIFFEGKRHFKSGSTRKQCGCAKSTDIGAYDTCPHGCVYCYANVNKEKARKVYEDHDRQSTFLGYSVEQSEAWIQEIHQPESV